MMSKNRLIQKHQQSKGKGKGKITFASGLDWPKGNYVITKQGGRHYTDGDYKGNTIYGNGRVLTPTGQMGTLINVESPEFNYKYGISIDANPEVTTPNGGKLNPATGIVTFPNGRQYNARTKQMGSTEFNMNKEYFVPDNWDSKEPLSPISTNPEVSANYHHMYFPVGYNPATLQFLKQPNKVIWYPGIN